MNAKQIVGVSLLAGVILAVIAVVTVKVFTLPPVPQHVAHKADLGDQAFANIARLYVVQAAQAQGLPVLGSKVVSVKQGSKPYERIVRVKLETAIGTYLVDVKMSKSVWSPQGLSVVGQVGNAAHASTQ